MHVFVFAQTWQPPCSDETTAAAAAAAGWISDKYILNHSSTTFSSLSSVSVNENSLDDGAWCFYI